MKKHLITLIFILTLLTSCGAVDYFTCQTTKQIGISVFVLTDPFSFGAITVKLYDGHFFYDGVTNIDPPDESKLLAPPLEIYDVLFLTYTYMWFPINFSVYFDQLTDGRITIVLDGAGYAYYTTSDAVKRIVVTSADICTNLYHFAGQLNISYDKPSTIDLIKEQL